MLIQCCTHLGVCRYSTLSLSCSPGAVVKCVSCSRAPWQLWFRRQIQLLIHFPPQHYTGRPFSPAASLSIRLPQPAHIHQPHTHTWPCSGLINSQHGLLVHFDHSVSPSLSQALLWWENRSLLCVAGLVHRHVDPCCHGWRFCLPLWSLHYGLQPSQVSSHSLRLYWYKFRMYNLNIDCRCHIWIDCLISKEICEANTTTMCPMCEDCQPWRLNDSCVYAKVSALLMVIHSSVCLHSSLQTCLGPKGLKAFWQ